MKKINQLALILIVLWVGQSITSILSLQLPGNVIGMILLLVLLSTRIIKLEQVEDIAEVILGILAFFFVPVGVGLINVFHLIKGQAIILLIVLLISFTTVVVVTGLVVQVLVKIIEKRGNNDGVI